MRTTLALWVFTGAVSSVLAPACVLVLRRRLGRWPAARSPRLVAPAFVLLHAAVTISLVWRMAPALWAALHAVLLAGAMLYWLPVLHPARHLEGAARFLYLAISSPWLDAAGLVVIVLGERGGGIAMILAMLPVNIVGVFVLWRWMVEQEGVAGGTLPGAAVAVAERPGRPAR